MIRYNLYKNLNNLNNVSEMCYFFTTLINQISINNFIKFYNKGLVDTTLHYAKNDFNEPKKIIYVLELLNLFLFEGELLEKEYSQKNVIKEKCEFFGLKEILKKYENSKDSNLSELVENMLQKYFDE